MKNLLNVFSGGNDEAAAKAAAEAKSNEPEKNYVVVISLSQGKFIPFSSSILRIECGNEKYEIARKTANPVYNETKELHFVEAPNSVKFTLLESHWIGDPSAKATFRVDLFPQHFQPATQTPNSAAAAASAAAASTSTSASSPTTSSSPPSSPQQQQNKKTKVVPLCWNSFVPLAEVAKNSEYTEFGQFELEIKTGMRDKSASLAYRDTLGVLSAKFCETVDIKPSSSAKNLYYVEVDYGLHRFCTRGSKTGKFDDQMRVWVYQQTKDYRIEFNLMERSESQKSGGNIVGICLVSAGSFIDQNKDAKTSQNVTCTCTFEPRKSNESSDRDHGTLQSNTVDIAKKAAGISQTPTVQTPRGSSGPLPTIRVEFTYSPRAVAEQMFFEGLWKHFDADTSGALDRVEVAAMLDTLHVNMTDDEITEFVSSVDSNNDGNLDHEEVMRLLQSGEFQKSALSAQMMQFLLDGREGLDRMIDSTGTSVKMVDGHAVSVTNEGDTEQDDMGLLIFDRNSGQMLHEHIPWYIKVALKSMYRSGFGRKVAQSSKVREMLVAQSKAEGVKMDDPASKQKIKGFIEQYGLDVNEMLDPVEKFPHFNAFFYRKLKPGARPVDAVDDHGIAVSPADSRMSVFPRMTDATKVWIKGSEFTVEKLLGTRTDLLPFFTNPTLVIARLAPQDYHRVHLPVSGTIGKITTIDGTLYTVNPIAVREEVNVYTENLRTIIPIQTKEFGLVVSIMVGATMVGSINVNEEYTKEGAYGKKGDDLGYFAFGGSTTLLLFQPGSIDLDHDLVEFSTKPIEVLLRVGSHIGRATGNFAESASSAEASIENLRTYFGRFDVDESGFLDLSEAIGCCSLLFPDESVTEIVARIKRADQANDNDGRMSFLEFVTIAKEVEHIPHQRTQLAVRLQKFYEQYNKEAVRRIPDICDKYLGREEELFKSLTEKYGPEPR